MAIDDLLKDKEKLKGNCSAAKESKLWKTHSLEDRLAFSLKESSLRVDFKGIGNV